MLMPFNLLLGGVVVRGDSQHRTHHKVLIKIYVPVSCSLTQTLTLEGLQIYDFQSYNVNASKRKQYHMP